MKTTVGVIDSHAAVRELLGMLLVQEGGYEIVAEAGSGFQALKMLKQRAPRLVILDLILPELSGMEVLRYLRAETRETRVLVFSGTQDGDLIFEALQTRPHGFVQKQDSLATFREALHAVARGCSYLTPRATEIIDSTRGRNERPWATLTERERMVLQMVAEGLRSKEVATRLSVSPKTVDYYRTQLMKKLDLHDFPALTKYAIRKGLLSLD